MPSGAQPTGQPSASLERVREVLTRHRAALTARYGAQGLGIGKRRPGDPGSGEYLIVIYLESRRNLPEEEVAVEGVQVRFVVTGKFTPL